MSEEEVSRRTKRTDRVLLQSCHVSRIATLGQDAAVHSRVERLDAAVQHLGKGGERL